VIYIAAWDVSKYNSLSSNDFIIMQLGHTFAQIGFGIVISIVAAAVLLPVTVLIATVLRQSVEGPIARGARRVIGDRGPEWSIDIGDKVETAIIGGIIGGVVFTSLLPAIAPVMSDFHVQSGIVEQPEPSLDVQAVDGISSDAIADQYNVSADDEYSLYVLDLQNHDQRTVEDYNLNVRFPGCVERTSLGATNLGTAVVSNQSGDVQVGEFENRSANSTCYGAVGIDEFPPGNSAVVSFVVDETPERSREPLYPRPDSPGTALVTRSFTWDYNDRSYSADATLERVSLSDTNLTRA
jgi:hypothetical protein